MSEKYLAITFGPVLDLITTARTTREMWASSYLLSYLVRKIVFACLEQGIGEVLSPNMIGAEINDFGEKGAGLCPDRIFIRVEDTQHTGISGLWPVVSEELYSLSKKMAERGDKNPSREQIEEIYDYLKSYFRIFAQEMDLEENKNIVFTMTPYLDAAELQPRLPKPRSGVSPLRLFTDRVNGSFLLRDGFTGKTKTRFLSLIEIAVAGLEKQGGPEKSKQFDKLITKHFENNNLDRSGTDGDEVELINGIKRIFGTEQAGGFRFQHKYICIVHADGDNIGKVIAALSKEGDQVENFKCFSARLLKYAQKATDLIVEYGGSPVYMGGDDMFFFAPMSTFKDGKAMHIFNLIAELNKNFTDDLVSYAKDLGLDECKLPSLSFGLCVSYYKYPLYEARNASYDLMKNVAKKRKGKNAVAVKFLKHSGQSIQFVLPNTEERRIFNAFLALLENNIKDDAFLNSFTYKLESQRVLLESILRSEVPKQRLESFFENNFNENFKRNSSFFASLIDFILVLAEGKKDFNKDDYDCLYGALRFIHFMRQPDQD